MASSAIDLIANVIGAAYISLLGLANSASGIPFVGSVIANGIRAIAFKIPGIITGLAQLKVALQRLGDGVDINALIPRVIWDLANYAYNLISFITDPLPKIRQYIQWLYPQVMEFLNNPLAWVVNVVRNLSGIPVQLLTDAFGFIVNVVNTALGVLLAFKSDPIGFIRSAVDQLFPVLRVLSSNPIAWLDNLLLSRFPFLGLFFADPIGYIVESFITGIERLMDRYRDRLIKLFETILNAIF